MKEDYLWDRAGTDPEIEKLENALRAFRYEEKALPVLPAKVVPIVIKAPRRSFQFAVAAAACLMFGVIAFGVWFQIFRNTVETNSLAQVDNSQNQAALSDKQTVIETTPVVSPSEDTAENTGNSKTPTERKIIKVRQSYPVYPVIKRAKQVKASEIKDVAPNVSLTKEEKFAYDQLMLALSITSSKLKIVKDKVDGLEENPVVPENGR